MTGERVGDGQGAAPGNARPNGPAGFSPRAAALAGAPVRDRLVRFAQLRSKRLASPLDGFLAEPDAALALVQWFGARELAGLAREGRGALKTAIDRDVAWIDGLLAGQVDAILHHPRFQRLEASWRGIAYLARQADPDDGVVVRLITWSWRDLGRDLERALQFDQSQLFNKIYNQEFGMPGGEPFGVLLGDYQVQHRPTTDHPSVDIPVLQGVMQVAAAAFTPFIVGCTPALLGLESFAQLSRPLDLSGLFHGVDYARWRSLQHAPDARFVGVVLPRVLMRRPYRDDGTRNDGFRYEEQVAGPDPRRYLWGSAVYAFGAVLIRAFRQNGWFADIRGVRKMPADEPEAFNGGLIPDLPVDSFPTDRDGLATKAPVEVRLSEAAERELAGLGLIPVSVCRNTPWLAFRSAQSVQQPERYDREAATVNARLSAMLQYVFCVSRFSHYVKVIMRDRLGSFTTADECERHLTNWLLNYITTNIDASLSEKARYPLQDGRVRVREQPGKPGSYLCEMYFRPHFQPTDVVANFRLVTELAAAGSG